MKEPKQPTKATGDMITALEQAVSYLLRMAHFDEPLDLRLTYLPGEAVCLRPMAGSESEEPSGPNVPLLDIIPQGYQLIHMECSRLKEAHAVLHTDGSVTILPGSYVHAVPNTKNYSRENAQKFYRNFENLIRKMIKNGSVRRVDDELILQEPCYFRPKRRDRTALSPSAEFLLGYPVNGWEAWLDENGIKLRERKTTDLPDKSELPLLELEYKVAGDRFGTKPGIDVRAEIAAEKQTDA